MPGRAFRPKRTLRRRKGMIHFPEIVSKGDNADVEKTAVRRTPVSGVSGLLGLPTHHKRALTVRLLAHERSTSCDLTV